MRSWCGNLKLLPLTSPHALAWFDWLWSCPTAAWVSGSWIPLGCRAGARLRVNARPRHQACTLMPRPLTRLSPSSLGSSLPPPLSPLLPLAVNEPGKAVMPPPRPPVPHTNTHLPHFLFTLLGLPVTPVQSCLLATGFPVPKCFSFPHLCEIPSSLLCSSNTFSCISSFFFSKSVVFFSTDAVYNAAHQNRF